MRTAGESPKTIEKLQNGIKEPLSRIYLESQSMIEEPLKRL